MESTHYKDVFEYDKKILKSWNHIDIRNSDEMPIWHYSKPERILKNIRESKINLGSLLSMDDLHEGDFPIVTHAQNFWDGYSDVKNVYQHIEASQLLKQHLFVNCWTARPEEYEGFWKAFTDLKDGIAIKTCAGKLSRELSRLKKLGLSKTLKMFNVKYANFESINKYKNWEN